MDATRVPDADDTSPGLLSSAVGDRCSNCNAPLASDQRYCVNCGTRRGKPRFTLDSSTARTAPAKAAAPPPRKRRQPTTAMTVIGFIGVLLLAMGVGVLIGHTGNNTTTTQAASTKPIVVNVGGGGVAAGTGAVAAASTAASTHKSSKTKASTSKSSGGSAKNGAKTVSGNNANGNGAAAAKHIDKKTAAAASNAAAKALGSGPVSNPTVQPGQAATGPGTSGGKFTGTFFSGGQ
jgi:hypothetical protein